MNHKRGSEILIKNSQSFVYRYSSMEFAFWNPVNSSVDLIWEGHKDLITKAVVLPKKSRVLTSSLDKTIRIWRLKNTVCEGILKGHESGIKELIATFDEEYAASVDLKGFSILWDLNKQKLAFRFYDRHFRTQSLAVIKQAYAIFGNCNQVFVYKIRSNRN